MTTYTPPVKDLQFVLHDLLKISQSDIPGYDELDADFTSAVLGEAGKIASEVLHPLNAVGDKQGCSLKDGVVTVPDGFQDAYDQMRDGGWMALDGDPEYGGQGMPAILGLAVNEMFVSANMAFNMYQGLSHGNAQAIHAHGSDAQKALYLPKMYTGEWSGTMNLTEPHCGTDLGLIKTKAEPQDDGSYKISGQKIWISAGEHELADNIIHLVLAKIPGGPDGIKGISLFIVPKFLVNEDGSLGERNSLECVSLEHKMGIHGNATCVMSYEGATGYLIGDMHKGMRAMFTMMNEARLGVGIQGYAQASVAYQNAVEFARDRLQGRDHDGAHFPDKPADPIIVHPDVRRGLLHQKSFVEGARAFVMWGANLIDQAKRKDDAAAEGLVSLLTPVIKGFLTDQGFDSCVLSQQTPGGSGFTQDLGIEQFVRDARITMIYEGTNGIQSLDLVGRKMGADGGKHIMGFFDLIRGYCKENADDEAFAKDFIEPLKQSSKELQEAAMFFMQNMKDPDQALAGSYDFMHLFGHVCLGYMWAQMAQIAQAKLGQGDDDAWLQAKIKTGRYYMARQMPATSMHLARIKSGATPVMAMADDQF